MATNQADAWRALFALVEKGQFDVSEKIACKVHALAGKEETLEWGRFRSGMVTIAGTEYLPPDAGQLPSLFENLADELLVIPDIYDQAIHLFFIDGKKSIFFMTLTCVWVVL